MLEPAAQRTDMAVSSDAMTPARPDCRAGPKVGRSTVEGHVAALPLPLLLDALGEGGVAAAAVVQAALYVVCSVVSKSISMGQYAEKSCYRYARATACTKFRV